MVWLSSNKLPQRTIRWLTLTVWVLTVAAGVTLVLRVQNALQSPLNVFPTYYTAAKLITNGEDISRFYDDVWFRERAAEFEPRAIEIYNANTPLMGFFFLPVAQLSYVSARYLTSALVFAALLAAVYLMAMELGVTGAWRSAAFFAIFAAPTTLVNLSHAQVYPLVLLILVLAWRAWRKHAEGIGGILIGIALAFKTAGLFLLPLMVLEKRWRALLAVIFIIGGLILVTFPIVGRDGWSAYLHYALGLLERPRLSVASYWSVTGFARNLFSYNVRTNPDPYIDAPALALSIEVLLSLVFFIAAAKVTTVTKDRDVTFALFMILSLILVPVTNRTTMCLGFLPAFVIFSRIRNRIVSPLGAWFFLGGFLSFAPGVERVRVLADWGGPIFLYSRFFGLIVLMGVLMALGIEDKKSSVSRPTGDAVKA